MKLIKKVKFKSFLYFRLIFINYEEIVILQALKLNMICI
ncbi:hypothetical protein FORC25_1066 [Clostridium perfringens]|nr:hypothetical protein FORC25_1066 [Clostridium perfringens]